MKNYLRYYDEDRTHLGLGKDRGASCSIGSSKQRQDHRASASQWPASPLHTRSLSQLSPERTGLSDCLLLGAPDSRIATCALRVPRSKLRVAPAGSCEATLSGQLPSSESSMAKPNLRIFLILAMDRREMEVLERM